MIITIQSSDQHCFPVGSAADGILLELVFRYLERWAVSRNRRRTSLVLITLHWHPRFWGIWKFVFLNLTIINDLSSKHLRVHDCFGNNLQFGSRDSQGYPN